MYAGDSPLCTMYMNRASLNWMVWSLGVSRGTNTLHSALIAIVSNPPEAGNISLSEYRNKGQNLHINSVIQ